MQWTSMPKVRPLSACRERSAPKIARRIAASFMSLLCVFAVLFGSASAQLPPAPLGPEFLVASMQDRAAVPAVASNFDDSFLVVWSNPTAPFSLSGQRYDGSGVAVGTEFLISSGASYLGDPTQSAVVRAHDMRVDVRVGGDDSTGSVRSDLRLDEAAERGALVSRRRPRCTEVGGARDADVAG